MKIILETTRFDNDIQIDINYLKVQIFSTPLVIATREAQRHRILDWQDRNNYPEFPIIGWWNLLSTGYICANGLVESKWKQHDGIFFLDKERCSDKKSYSTLIQLVKLI